MPEDVSPQVDSQNQPNQTQLPDRAQVVIVGGGIVGCSVAYHLTRRGITDVVLLEQNTLTAGTTWHAAGLVAQLRSSYSQTMLAHYSARLFEELEDETGQATGYRIPGSLAVASDQDRWEELLRTASMAKTVGVEANVMPIEKAAELWPLMRTDDLVGALHIPHDGVTSPVDTTMALAKGAKSRGAKIFEGVSVTDINTVTERLDTRITGVVTENGSIEAETVVLCSGMWTRELANKIGVNVPLQACEHFYIVTEPVDGVETGLATLRDPTNHTYYKEETGKIMAGFFEPRGKVWKPEGIPRDFAFGTIGEDWEHIGPVFERAIHRVPVLGEVGLQLFFNGPESFTPDGVYYLGEAPEVDNCFVAAGFNSVGIQSSGGVGWALADWIADGHPHLDLSSVDLRRAKPFQADQAYLEGRISESLGLLYQMHWPFRQYESARGIKHSPIHDRLVEAGAVFGELAGWERPNWYATGGETPEYEYSYGKQNWHDASGRECEAVRNAVGIFDQTSFVKFRVEGPDALKMLNNISVADMDAPIGKAVYTQWCNERGGIEADLTITRLTDDRFFVVTAAAAAVREYAWMRRHSAGLDLTITDVTMDMAMLGVMGPHARALLSGLTDASLSNDDFPFGTGQHITVAGHEVLALRLSYVGELGWELYMPNDSAGPVYDAIVAAGPAHGLMHAGYHAMNTLRVEAGYRHWGDDITDEDTPIEAGLSFAIAWDKGEFIGREALAAQKELPRTKRLIQFKLGTPDKLLYHDEPIYRDGVLVGRTASAMWSYIEDASLAMGYLEHDEAITKDWLDAGTFEIEVAGTLYPATTSIRSWYDPNNDRVKL